MSTPRCPCDRELIKPAEQAHGICDGCRITAKKRVPRSEPAPTLPLFDEPEPGDRRLVPLNGWPDYHAQGVRT
jgi:hypothetical protein